MNKFLKLFLILLCLMFITFSISCFNQASRKETAIETKKTTDEKAEEKPSEKQEPKSEENYPEAIGYVNDFAGVLEQEHEDRINALAKDLEQETTAELVVVTIDSLGGKTIEEYAFGLFNSWGIGKKDKNNGILFLVAMNEREFRIEVGLGLGTVITNETAKNILDEIVTPRFKEGEFGLGSYECVKEISVYIISSN